MLAKLEHLQKLQKEAMDCKGLKRASEKYCKIAAREYKRLSKDLERLYMMHTKVRMREEELCRKWGIEIDIEY